MARPNRFRNVAKVGPTQVGTRSDIRGREKHTVACTAPGCNFSGDYNDRAAADLAAATHQCPAR